MHKGEEDLSEDWVDIFLEFGVLKGEEDFSDDWEEVGETILDLLSLALANLEIQSHYILIKSYEF